MSSPNQDQANLAAKAREAVALLERISSCSMNMGEYVAFEQLRGTLRAIDEALNPRAAPVGWTFSGVCQCGHPFNAHRLTPITDRESLALLPAGHPAFLGGACTTADCTDGEHACVEWSDEAQGYRVPTEACELYRDRQMPAPALVENL